MLRNSILGKSNIKRNWNGIDGMNPVEMTPLNDDNEKIKKTNYMLNMLTKNNTNFEDTVVSKHLYNQLYIIAMVRILLSVIICLLGMNLYEYYDPRKNLDYTTKTIINIWLTIFCILSVILYIYSLWFEGNYLKRIKYMSDKTNVFSYFGIENMIICSILLLIHQIYESGNTQLTSEETYWTGSERVSFKRNLNEYLTIIQFTVHYFSFLYILIIKTPWGNPKVNRICRLNNVENDFLFILKSNLDQSPQYVPLIFLIILLFYFSVVIRFIEQGFQRSLRYSDFGNDNDFTAAWVSRGNFDNYKNTYWNMFITMATIGYGEFNVKSTFSRFYLFFIVLAGFISTSIMVIAYSKFFELEGVQNFAYNFFNALEIKIQMRKMVSLGFNAYIKMLFCCKNQKYNHYKYYRRNSIKYLDKYKILRNHYAQMYGASDFDIMGISFIKIDDYLDQLILQIYKQNKLARAKAHALSDENKIIFKILFSPISNSRLSIVEEQEEKEGDENSLLSDA